MAAKLRERAATEQGRAEKVAEEILRAVRDNE